MRFHETITLPEFSEKQKQSVLSKISRDEGCWQWTGTKCMYGYGVVSVGGRQYRAHRLAYEFMVGKVPAGQWVLHRCDNRICCNPKHLFLGDHWDNIGDRSEKGRSAKGDTDGNSELTESQVVEILRLHMFAPHTQTAKTFNVSSGCIKCVLQGKTWRHVAPEIERQQARPHHRGGNNPNRKLTPEDVSEILKTYTKKRGQAREMASKYGVSKMTIFRIVSGKSWR